jgi:hypothetical protein
MWHDEIHFTGAGWERIAQQWMTAIDAAVAQAPSTPVAFGGLRLPATPILRPSAPTRKVAAPRRAAATRKSAPRKTVRAPARKRVVASKKSIAPPAKRRRTSRSGSRRTR